MASLSTVIFAYYKICHYTHVHAIVNKLYKKKPLIKL